GHARGQHQKDRSRAGQDGADQAGIHPAQGEKEDGSSVKLYTGHTTSSEGICSENESLDTEEIAVRIVLRSAAFAPTGPHGRFAGDKGTYQYLAPVYELFQGRLGISC